MTGVNDPEMSVIFVIFKDADHEDIKEDCEM